MEVKPLMVTATFPASSSLVLKGGVDSLFSSIMTRFTIVTILLFVVLGSGFGVGKQGMEKNTEKQL